MSVNPQFTGYIDEGAKFVPDDPRKFAEHRQSLAGQLVEVVMRKQKSKRSIQQNKWLWGCALELLVADYGYEKRERGKAKEDLHYSLLKKCFGTHWDERLKDEIPNISSSKLKTKQFSAYMEWLVRYAAQECNCKIPLPDEVDLDELEVED